MLEHRNQALIQLDTTSLTNNLAIIWIEYLPISAVYETLCVYDIICHGEDKPDYVQPFIQASHTNIYQTKVRYNCGNGRKFNMTNGETNKTLELECDQHGNWSHEMMNCICKSVMCEYLQQLQNDVKNIQGPNVSLSLAL